MRPTDIPCPPPIRDTLTPRTVFPSGACDTHAHICGPQTKYPYDERRIYTPPDATAQDYLRLLKTLGVSRAVLVQPSVYGTDNTALIETLDRLSSGARGIAVVDEAFNTAAARLLDDRKVRGIRLNLVDRKDGKNIVPRDLVAQLTKIIAPLGWHIEFLVNMDEAPGFAEVVADLPVDVVVGHLGYPKMGAAPWPDADGFADFLGLFETGRCWVKLTGPYRISGDADLPYADVAPLARILGEINPERLLWGTDWPHVMMKKPMANDGPLADLLADWLPDAKLRSRVLVTNPAALYGFQVDEALPVSVMPWLHSDR